MSLITSCPACGTMFKVVADQLRISEGWVRCGHCAEIFDASAHMQDAETPAAASPVAAESSEAFPASSAPMGRAAPTDDAPPAPPAPAPTAIAVQDEAYPPFELRRADPGSQEPAAPTATTPPVAVARGWVDSEPLEDPQEPAPLPDLGFVRDARRRAFWRRPVVRLALLLLALLLGALLAAQWAIHERDRLAAWRPQLVPVLQALCKPVACTLGPLRRIDAVTIDSSAFTKVRPDLYRLNFTLKNQAAPAVAFPALELTLTDTQDQPVLRRVLTAHDVAAGTRTIAGNGEWSGSVVVAVSANGSASRVAGYRLLAFYP